MKQLLEDILHTLNQLPNRKIKGKDFTTYELAKRVEEEIPKIDTYIKLLEVLTALEQHLNEETIIIDE